MEIEFTTLFYFQRIAVLFEDTSVTTSDDPQFSLVIFTISRHGAFSIRFALTVPVATALMVLKYLSKAGFVN